jgi:hypothetical protein
MKILMPTKTEIKTATEDDSLLVFHKAGVHLTIGINNHRALLSLAIGQEQLFGLQPCMHVILQMLQCSRGHEKKREAKIARHFLVVFIFKDTNKLVGGGSSQ